MRDPVLENLESRSNLSVVLHSAAKRVKLSDPSPACITVFGSLRWIGRRDGRCPRRRPCRFGGGRFARNFQLLADLDLVGLERVS